MTTGLQANAFTQTLAKLKTSTVLINQEFLTQRTTNLHVDQSTRTTTSIRIDPNHPCAATLSFYLVDALGLHSDSGLPWHRFAIPSSRRKQLEPTSHLRHVGHRIGLPVFLRPDERVFQFFHGNTGRFMFERYLDMDNHSLAWHEHRQPSGAANHWNLARIW